ncbi:rab-like protein 2A isoform X4 [Apteryx rowi]|uniref:rab-like protein 2A isoform X4 n=1 Tax=Apteryx rowi TaxID=308060 RepID=UPI000E1E0FE9|nr:rab-like protein 2A isoform X4 [Apteryx rowi]
MAPLLHSLSLFSSIFPYAGHCVSSKEVPKTEHTTLDAVLSEVFDVQRKVTYKNLSSWYKELREFRPEIPCIVVANKIDADMKVTQKSFNFARKFNLPFYFVSAADGTNVVKLFNDAIKLAVAYKQNSGDFMDEVMRELEGKLGACTRG